MDKKEKKLSASRKNDFALKFRKWFKYGLKVQKLLAQSVWGETSVLHI